MRSLLLFLVALAPLAVGCDKSGVHPLGRVRDTLGACQGPTATWLRSTDTGTEVFLIGEATVGEDGLPVPGCFAQAFVEHNSATHLLYGDLTLSAPGEGTFSYGAEYDFRYQPERGILTRQGSRRTDRDPPITTAISFEADGDQLLLTFLGEQRRLTNLLDVIDALDTTTMSGADDVLRMYNLPLLVSQTRLLGFGASGMTQYINSKATFAGTIANTFTVLVENPVSPNTYIDYIDFEDLTGIIIDGEQRTFVNLSGDGTMDGELDFTMEGRTRDISGTVDYANLIIDNGVAADGTYGLSIDGGDSYVLSFSLAANVDLRAVLPVSAP